MAANYRDEMLLAEEMNPELRKKRKPAGAYPEQRPQAPGTSANELAAMAGGKPTQYPTQKPQAPGTDVAELTAYRAPTPAPAATTTPTGASMPSYRTEMLAVGDMKPATGVASGERMAGSSAGMTDLGYGQQARDTRMLKTESNIATAKLMGASNPYSAFNPSNRNYTPDRADMIREKAMLNEQLAVRNAADAPAPRYESDPNSPRAVAGRNNLTNQMEMMLYNEAQGKQLPGGQPGPVDTSGVAPRVDAFKQAIAPKAPDYETMLARERGENRYNENKALARADADKRTEGRETASKISNMETERILATSDAERRIAMARASREEADVTRAQTEAAGARVDADIAAMVLPAEANRAKADAMKASDPRWTETKSRVLGAVRMNSGKDPDAASLRQLDAASQSIEQMDPEARKLLSAEILSELAAEPGMDLPKEALESSAWRWLDFLDPYSAAYGAVANDAQPGFRAKFVGWLTGANKSQAKVNDLLTFLQREAAQAKTRTTPAAAPAS